MLKGHSPCVSCQELGLQEASITPDIFKNNRNWNRFSFILRQRHFFPFLSSSVDMHRSLLTGGMELQTYYKYQRWLDRDSWKRFPPYLECSDTVSFNCFSTLHYINNRLAGFLADEEKGKVGWWFWMNEDEDELLALKLVWGSRNTKSCEVGQYFCLLFPSLVLLNCFYKCLACIHT